MAVRGKSLHKAAFPSQQRSKLTALRAERIYKGWTQAKLALLLQASKEEVDDWENCREFPASQYHGKIKELLGVKL